MAELKNETEIERSFLEMRTGLLESKVAYLLDEVSGLRSLVRYLAADRIRELPVVQETKDSFNYQWGHLPEGRAMLSNVEWKKTVGETICQFSGLPAAWFPGKRIIDAGCGEGRWTYGFGVLQAGACVSFDISEYGLDRTREIARQFGGHFEVMKKNVLNDLGLPADFDLVWCFGVLHHTGDTYRGFRNLARCVKPGGYLFLMLYGEPRPDRPDDYDYYHEMATMRRRLRNLPFEEKVKALEQKYDKDLVHGYFDATSPPVNDLYRWDEIEGWLLEAGFEDIRRTLPDHPNHHLIARKKTG
jgi:SAM-dependent methyltransferase